MTKFEAGNKKEYEIKRIWDSTVYTKKSVVDHLPGLYFWKSYPKKENTWKPISIVQYLQKLLSIFHKNNPDKPAATSSLVDITYPLALSTMAWPCNKPIKAVKQKHSRPATSS